MEETRQREMLKALEIYMEKEGLGKIEYTPVRWNEQVHKDVEKYIREFYRAHEATVKSKLPPWASAVYSWAY